MDAIKYTDARMNLAQMMEETAYLLRSPKNTRRLLESISQLESGAGKKRNLIE